MSSTNGKREAETEAFTAQVAAAERVARAIVVAFDVCDEVGKPLVQIQKIAIIEAALLEFDGFDAQLSSLARIGELLHALGANGRNG